MVEIKLEVENQYRQMLKVHAAQEGKTLKQFILDAILEHLKRKNGGRK